MLVEGLCALLEQRHPLAAALARLRLLTYGGAALPSHCAATLRAHRIASACTYGQTETAGPVLLGAISGDLHALRPIGGAAFALRPQEGEEGEGGDEGGAGELLLRGLGCVSPSPRGWEAEEAAPRRARAPPAAPGEGGGAAGEWYGTGDLFSRVEREGGAWLLYACRADDVLAHTSGELTNPHPPEDCVQSLCVGEVTCRCVPNKAPH